MSTIESIWNSSCTLKYCLAIFFKYSFKESYFLEYPVQQWREKPLNFLKFKFTYFHCFSFVALPQFYQRGLEETAWRKGAGRLQEARGEGEAREPELLFHRLSNLGIVFYSRSLCNWVLWGYAVTTRPRVSLIVGSSSSGEGRKLLGPMNVNRAGIAAAELLPSSGQEACAGC